MTRTTKLITTDQVFELEQKDMILATKIISTDVSLLP
jgi:hypothetical protein